MLSFVKFAIFVVCAGLLYWMIKWWTAKEEPFFSTGSLANSKKEKRKALSETCADKEGLGVDNLILEKSPIREAEESKKQSASTEANIKKEEERKTEVGNLGISEAVTEVSSSVTAELTSDNKLANDYAVGAGMKSVEEDSFNTTENISLATEKSEQKMSKIEDKETEKILSVSLIETLITTGEAKKSDEKLVSTYATIEGMEIVRMAAELNRFISTLKITTEVSDPVEADLTPFDKLVKDDKKTTEDFAKSKYTSAIFVEDLDVAMLQQENMKKEGHIFDKLEQEEMHNKKKKKKKSSSVTAELTSVNKLANDYAVGVGMKSVEEDSFNTTENISLATEESEQKNSKIEDKKTEKILSVSLIETEITAGEAKKSDEKLVSTYATIEGMEIVRMADELKGCISTLKITTEVSDSVEADLTPFDKLVKDEKKTTEDFAKSKYTSAIFVEDLYVAMLQQENMKKEGQIFDKLEQEEMHTKKKKKKKKKKFVQSGIPMTINFDLQRIASYGYKQGTTTDIDDGHRKVNGGVKGLQNCDELSCCANSTIQCLFSTHKNLFNVLSQLRGPISNEIKRLAFSSLEKTESTKQLIKLLPSRYGFSNSFYQCMAEFWDTLFDCVDNENIPNYANRLSYQSPLSEIFHFENRKYLICDICRWSEIEDHQMCGKLLYLAVPESYKDCIPFNRVLNPSAVDRHCPNGHELTSRIVFTQTSPFLAVALNRNLPGFNSGNLSCIVNIDFDKIILELAKDNSAEDSCYHDLLLSSVNYKAVAIGVRKPWFKHAHYLVYRRTPECGWYKWENSKVTEVDMNDLNCDDKYNLQKMNFLVLEKC